MARGNWLILFVLSGRIQGRPGHHLFLWDLLFSHSHPRGCAEGGSSLWHCRPRGQGHSEGNRGKFKVKTHSLKFAMCFFSQSGDMAGAIHFKKQKKNLNYSCEARIKSKYIRRSCGEEESTWYTAEAYFVINKTKRFRSLPSSLKDALIRLRPRPWWLWKRPNLQKSTGRKRIQQSRRHQRPEGKDRPLRPALLPLPLFHRRFNKMPSCWPYAASSKRSSCLGSRVS